MVPHGTGPTTHVDLAAPARNGVSGLNASSVVLASVFATLSPYPLLTRISEAWMDVTLATLASSKVRLDSQTV